MAAWGFRVERKEPLQPRRGDPGPDGRTGPSDSASALGTGSGLRGPRTSARESGGSSPSGRQARPGLGHEVGHVGIGFEALDDVLVEVSRVRLLVFGHLRQGRLGQEPGDGVASELIAARSSSALPWARRIQPRFSRPSFVSCLASSAKRLGVLLVV